MSIKKGRGRPKKGASAENKNKDILQALSSSKHISIESKTNRSVREDQKNNTNKDVPTSIAQASRLEIGTNVLNVETNQDMHDMSIEGSKPRSEDQQPKKRGRPKGTKNGKGEKKLKIKKIENNDVLKVEAPKFIRVSKQLTSVKDKLVRIYGKNKEKLLGLAIQKETFETSVFDLKTKDLLPSPVTYVDVTNLLSMDSFSTVAITKDELDKFLPLNNGEISFEVDEEQLNFLKNEVAALPKNDATERKAYALNVGGFISDMAWTNIENSNTQYLAVSLSNNTTASDFDLRFSGRPTPKPSLINVYEFNIETEQMKLMYQLAHDFGLSWDMKWHPGYHSSDSEAGLLAGVFQDGTIKFLPILKTEGPEGPEGPVIRYLQTAAIEIYVKDSPITSFDFFDSLTLSCSFQNGYYGEIGLPSGDLYKYKQIFESFAISVKVVSSNFEDPLVCMGSVDGNCCLFDPKDIRMTKVFCTRTRGSNILPIAYIPQLYTIIRTDSLSSIKAFTPKAVFVDHNICQHENSVCSLGVSGLHPMLLSGSADGTIMLNNIVRRMLQGMKNNNEIYRYIRLWKWNYDKIRDTYLLDGNYEIFKFSNTETSNVRIDHAGLNIQSVKWIESINSGTWYAFANSAGFIVVEKLDG